MTASRLILKISTAVAICIAAAGTGAASAGERPATDVFMTFYEGGDIPLRYGNSSYGKKHIEEGHKAQINRVGGWDNMALDISHTLNGGKCGASAGKTTCNLTSPDFHGGFGKMRVVYVESANGMPDGRPKGIITAFYP
ncbi:hypothetical protein [Streptosporangium sp. NPDC006007]|uniref:hypothetical protein n=1 Tax=Streptosporangium sp. NPDC006007 TaxID=3154575 RepID=UPI0033B0765E